jgi:hypothetical protein
MVTRSSGTAIIIYIVAGYHGGKVRMEWSHVYVKVINELILCFRGTQLLIDF